jgi:hypothetical protein
MSAWNGWIVGPGQCLNQVIYSLSDPNNDYVQVVCYKSEERSENYKTMAKAASPMTAPTPTCEDDAPPVNMLEPPVIVEEGFADELGVVMFVPLAIMGCITTPLFG